MIERLRRALEQVETLPPDVQEWLAEQIEQLTRHDGSTGTIQVALDVQLKALRAQIVSSGAPLLSWQEVEAEVAERRGEHGPDPEQ
jgi:hypothetical protein